MLGSGATRRIWAAAVLVLVVGVFAALWAGCAHRAEPLPPLTVATGDPGGVYHVYGAGLAEIARSSGASVTATPTAASVENLRLVAEGRADIGFALADVAALAVNGDPPFEAPLRIAALARVYDNRTHLIVPADLPIERVEDLAGHRVSVGARNSGTELIAERVLDLAGVHPRTGILREQLSVTESAEALREGRLDAFFWSGGLPTRAVSDLAATTPIRLVDLAGYVEDLRGAHGDFFTEVSIPTGTYPGVGNVRTIGVPNLLVVNRDMPDDVAEEVTRLLFASREELIAVHEVALQLNPRAAIATLPVPLHPGAAEYYRSGKVAITAT